MDKTALLDMALEKLIGDMDDVEGSSAMKHSSEDCQDPLTCSQHDGELGDSLSDGKEPQVIKIEAHKMGLPSLEGQKDEDGDEDGDEKAEDGLTPEEAEALRKLLGK